MEPHISFRKVESSYRAERYYPYVEPSSRRVRPARTTREELPPRCVRHQATRYDCRDLPWGTGSLCLHGQKKGTAPRENLRSPPSRHASRPWSHSPRVRPGPSSRAGLERAGRRVPRRRTRSPGFETGGPGRVRGSRSVRLIRGTARWRPVAVEDGWPSLTFRERGSVAGVSSRARLLVASCPLGETPRFEVTRVDFEVIGLTSLGPKEVASPCLHGSIGPWMA